MLTCKKLLFVIVLLCAFLSNSQDYKIDSIKVLIKEFDIKKKNTRPLLSDSVKVILLNELYYYYVNYKPDDALRYSKEALVLSEKIKYGKGVANASADLGRIYSGRAQYELAFKYFAKARDLFIKSKDDFGLANIYNELGVIYAKQGNYPIALNNSFNALRLYEKQNKNFSAAGTYVNIGILYKHQNDFPNALKYYAKAISLYEKIKDEDGDFGLAATYNNIGQAYLKQGNYDKSIEALLKSDKIGKSIDSPYLNAENFQAIGTNYLKQKDYDKALAYYLKAMDSFVEISDNSGISNCHINIGYCYFKMGNTQKAIENTNVGLRIAKEISQLEWQNNAYRNLAEIYSKNNQYKLAYENQVLFKEANDAMFNAEKEKKFTQLQMLYDFNKIQDATKQKQLQKEMSLSEETDKQRTIKYIVMIALFCMTVLTFAIFYNLRRNQKQKAIIATQKEVVEKQNKVISQSLVEKETLLREIHHRVKNNLQIISSLLNIQSQHIQDENVLSSIQEGQSRVQAMSLIHQNLYQSDHLSNVDIENYLQQLVVYLSDMFVGDNKSIKVEVEAANIQFDIDTAIPLGLIVNELVSNAYKYAFSKNEEGKISIGIRAINDIDYELKVNDNGVGLPEDFDPKKSKSLGLKLVGILSRQLRGNMTSSTDNGTSFIIKFKDIKAYQSSIV